MQRWGIANVKTLVYDGSSFDSTQYVDIVNCTDAYLIKLVAPTLLRRYGVPEDVIAKVVQACTAPTMPAECRASLPGDPLLYTLNVVGTTYSGHPTRTTLGNTIRSLCYAAYIRELGSPGKGRLLFFGIDEELDVDAAGDDISLNGRDEAILLFSVKLRVTHADSMDAGCYGLGQVARELRIEDWDFFDFLSRDGYCAERFVVTRKLDRLVVNSNWTFGLPAVTSARSKSKRYRLVGLLNWAQASGNKSWGVGISFVKTWVERKFAIGMAPTNRAEARAIQSQLAHLEMIVDPDVAEYHVIPSLHQESLQNKYGWCWSYPDMVESELARGRNRWDFSDNYQVGSSR